MPASGSHHGVCAVGDDVYVIGGRVADFDISSSVLKYSVSSNTWTEAGNMPTARYGLSLCVIGSHIYCIGGSGGGRGLWRYVNDTESGVWSTLAPMSTARYGAAAFVLDGKIYVSGGGLAVGAPRTDEVERYDPVSGAWDTVASLPGGRAHGGGCSVRSEVNYFDWLLSGGRD